MPWLQLLCNQKINTCVVLSYSVEMCGLGPEELAQLGR